MTVRQHDSLRARSEHVIEEPSSCWMYHSWNYSEHQYNSWRPKAPNPPLPCLLSLPSFLSLSLKQNPFIHPPRPLLPPIPQSHPPLPYLLSPPLPPLQKPFIPPPPPFPPKNHFMDRMSWWTRRDPRGLRKGQPTIVFRKVMRHVEEAHAFPLICNISW